jgi:hypothetical protein
MSCNKRGQNGNTEQHPRIKMKPPLVQELSRIQKKIFYLFCQFMYTSLSHLYNSFRSCFLLIHKNSLYDIFWGYPRHCKKKILTYNKIKLMPISHQAILQKGMH